MTKYSLGHNLGDFFTSSSGHPDVGRTFFHVVRFPEFRIGGGKKVKKK
jgi:hypothetical protein